MHEDYEFDDELDQRWRNGIEIVYLLGGLLFFHFLPVS